MSVFKSRKSRAMELYEYALTLPLGSIERTNVLLDAQLTMAFEINKHSAWTDFNTTIQQMTGR